MAGQYVHRELVSDFTEALKLKLKFKQWIDSEQLSMWIFDNLFCSKAWNVYNIQFHRYSSCCCMMLHCCIISRECILKCYWETKIPFHGLFQFWLVSHIWLQVILTQYRKRFLILFYFILLKFPVESAIKMLRQFAPLMVYSHCMVMTLGLVQGPNGKYNRNVEMFTLLWDRDRDHDPLFPISFY